MSVSSRIISEPLREISPVWRSKHMTIYGLKTPVLPGKGFRDPHRTT